MDTYILPVMIYATETWAPSDAQLESLAVTQRKMERQIIGVSLLDHKAITWIRQQTQIEDIRDKETQMGGSCSLKTTVGDQATASLGPAEQEG